MAIGLVVVLFFFFIFLTIMFTKTWRWFHVTMVFFVFVSSIFLVVIATASRQTRSDWQSDHDAKEKTLLGLKAEFRNMSQGDPDPAKKESEDEKAKRADYLPMNMYDVRTKLARIMMDRGRVWRGAEVQSVQPNGNISTDWKEIKVKLTTAENPNQIKATDDMGNSAMVLYAFKEVPAPNEPAAGPAEDPLADDDGDDDPPPAPVKVPVVYMGEFEVVDAAPDDVTLSWTYAPSRIQRIQLQAVKTTTWVLYEKMPVDGHQPFSYEIANEIKLDQTKAPGKAGENADINASPLFGKMDSAEINQVFRMAIERTYPRQDPKLVANVYAQLISQNYYPNEKGKWAKERNAFIQALATFKFDPENKDHEPRMKDFTGYPNGDAATLQKMLDSTVYNYLRDGYQARAEDDPADVWVKVQFKKALKFKSANRERPELKVDSDKVQNRTEFFDKEGLALTGRLQRGEEVEFGTGELAVLNKGKLDEALKNLDHYRQYELEGLFEEDNRYDIYVRPLEDYRYHFKDIYQEDIYLLDRIRRCQNELMLLEDALQKTNAEIAYREDEKKKLTEDLQQYQREEAFLQKYQDDLKSQESGLRKELAAIFQRNQDLARQLAEINRQLTIEIDRRTNAVAPPDEGSER